MVPKQKLRIKVGFVFCGFGTSLISLSCLALRLRTPSSLLRVVDEVLLSLVQENLDCDSTGLTMEFETWLETDFLELAFLKVSTVFIQLSLNKKLPNSHVQSSVVSIRIAVGSSITDFGIIFVIELMGNISLVLAINE